MSRNKEQDLSRAVARIQSAILAVVMGFIGGLGLFVMTVLLLLKGGDKVGPHLVLLSNFFIGYSVSWSGSLVGFGWGFLAGGLLGWLIGQLYNQIVEIRFPGR